jgi:hypothetical protein
LSIAAISGVREQIHNLRISVFYGQHRVIILATVKDTDYIDLVFAHMEGNGYASAIARNTQARTNIFALLPTIGEDAQALAVGHNSVGEASSDLR